MGGSVASSIYGDPRSTNDIDFVVSLPLGRIASFRAALGPDFELDVDMLRDALRRESSAGFYLPVLTPCAAPISCHAPTLTLAFDGGVRPPGGRPARRVSRATR